MHGSRSRRAGRGHRRWRPYLVSEYVPGPSPRGLVAVSGGYDTAVRLWDLTARLQDSR
ncbi:hypothetical protein HS041_00140 [Planomonospora sp. ID67723]|uniref:hypothetical protein n=1 Tax=Planomonospora sp. ID67723 TaxID=2738134 RepID=UPI0018C3C35D|nr:hypothetical protein [Planomonospora sp. ID67723]MBG0826194.1 hypothetical protein [Planomonospora sp. ID67723]